MAKDFAIATSLFVGASGMNYCANSSAFKPDKIFNTPIGPSGTCGSWGMKMEPLFPLNTLDRCLQGFDISLEGYTGGFKESVIQVLEYMTGPGQAGCCGDDVTGSVCTQFQGDLHKDNCPVGQTPALENKLGEKLCVPCYGKILLEDDGRVECGHCWALDDSGCDENECMQLSGGMWKDGSCHMCNSARPDGCFEQASCEAAGHNWLLDGAQHRCFRCEPNPTWGDVYGCTQEQCTGDGLKWIPENMGDRARCEMCSPDLNKPKGCGKDACHRHMTAYPELGWSWCDANNMCMQNWEMHMCHEDNGHNKGKCHKISEHQKEVIRSKGYTARQCSY